MADFGILSADFGTRYASPNNHPIFESSRVSGQDIVIHRGTAPAVGHNLLS